MHLTREAILPERFLKAGPEPSCGAACVFTGVVRNHQEGRRVRRLYYECYASLADRQIHRIVEAAQARWGAKIQVRHRVGWLEVGDVAVVVAAYSEHRAEAFSASRKVIDEIKRSVPIWKKEYYEDGTTTWVSCAHEETKQ